VNAFNRSRNPNFLEEAIMAIVRGPTRYVPEDGYQSRREYRTALEEWLATIDADLFVTLSFAQDVRLGSARQLLGQWLARIDSRYLGRGWARRSSDERTFAVLVPENINTNLHYHCLMRLPSWGRTQGIVDRAATLERFWCRLMPRGTCDVELIYDLPGLARYIAKQLVRPGYSQHYMLASEFHTAAKSPIVSTQQGRPQATD
jgi:hypothetical protein